MTWNKNPLSDSLIHVKIALYDYRPKTSCTFKLARPNSGPCSANDPSVRPSFGPADREILVKPIHLFGPILPSLLKQVISHR